MDRVSLFTQEVKGSTPTSGICKNDFSNPIDQDIRTQYALTGKSGIRVAAGDCSVTERRQWRPPYQTGKTVYVHAKHSNTEVICLRFVPWDGGLMKQAQLEKTN